jgi:hypothetical protein
VLNGVSAIATSKIMGVGYELVSNVKTPYLFQLVNDASVSQVEVFTGFAGIGANDTTLGLTGTNGVSFYASQGAGASQQQVAQAVIVQDNENFVVALDGQSIANTENRIFLNRFFMNGLVDSTFGTDGQVELPHNYQHEYVRDMHHFTAAGVHKVLLAGYATSSGLSISGSLLIVYDLTNETVDSSFGGYQNHPSGTVFGYGQKGYVVGMQSNGRILVSGMGKDNLDLITAYTTTGRVDTTFGQQGYFTQGTQPLYTSVIDDQNRIVIAYNASDTVAVARILADGSGVDTTFGSDGFVDSTISPIAGNTNMRLALDYNNKIIAAAVLSNGTDIMIKRYDTDGTLDQSLTIVGSSVGNITNFTLAALLVDADNNITLLGHTTSALVAIRVTSTLSGLDTAFSTNGYHFYTIGAGSSQVNYDGILFEDGRILSVGYQG